MELPEKVTRSKPNRENVCRFCLKTSKSRINLTKLLRKRFLELTQTELQICDKLSSFICSKCAKQLKSAHSYREKLIQTQKDLMKEVTQNFMPEMINVKQEKIEDVEFEEVNGLSNENDVKQEVEEQKDFNLDDNLFEDYENLSFEDSITVEEEVKAEVLEIKTMKCEHEGCGEIFPNKKKFSAHLKKHRPKRKDKSAICSYCGVVLCSRWSLQKHVAR